MRIIVGLIGVKESGKSTIANITQENYLLDGVTCKQYALADKLKDVCSKVFDVPRINFDSQELKEVPFGKPKILTPEAIESILNEFKVSNVSADCYSNILNTELKTPRSIAQIVGTEVLRGAGDPDIHCKNLVLDDDIDVSIITDIRFPNELNYFSNNHFSCFIPLYISRDVAENKVTSDSHSSEINVKSMKSACVVIDNNGKIISTINQIAKKLCNHESDLAWKEEIEECLTNATIHLGHKEVEKFIMSKYKLTK